VSLFLNGPLSRGRLSRSGHFANWGFDREISEGQLTERESALETLVIGLQVQGMRLGSIAPAQRGDWRKEVLQWVGDHDGGADWRLEEDDLVEGRDFVRALPAVSAILESRARRSFLATKLAFLSLAPSMASFSNIPPSISCELLTF
jgi:hypothetical protein